MSEDFSKLPVLLGGPFLPSPTKIPLPAELTKHSGRITQVAQRMPARVNGPESPKI